VVIIGLTSALPPIIVFVAMAAGAVCRSFTRVDRPTGTTPNHRTSSRPTALTWPGAIRRFRPERDMAR